MPYHILRGHETGNIVVNGVVRVRRYEYICRLHKPTLMIDGVSKDGNTVEVYSKCPECGVTILQGFYNEN